MTLEHSRPAPATHQPNTAPAQTPTVQRRLAAGSGSYAVQARALAPRENVQMHGGGEDTADVHAAAASGIASGGGAMPFASQIQQSFGGHDIGHVQAHTGSAAVQASAAMGAEAYATGDHVAFGKSPDLHTAAHEAAHVVQQSAGVSLSGGVGQVGDAYENHADRVLSLIHI